ncbi:O-Antigen ligase [Allorhodopirellula solitaria]|uniref:O-Antigen ligase n=2 Tax=Allorhodopirellula solitaria TaxID=2527987 RepID=A0A5C5WMR3_9BACT|nr:O-Antigen ligase [Allorhodopirellula solitaria]
MVMLPILLAVDFGGIYHWSQYIAAFGIILAAILALPGLTDSTASSGLRQHAILWPLGVLVFWAFVQSVAMPASLIAWLSPGSYTAFTEWLVGLEVTSPGQAESGATVASMSVSPYDTSHVAALVTLMLPLCWAASIVFHARSRLMMLLSSLAIAGASVAVLGLYRKLDPTADLWIFQPKPNSFGGFVNRNNAALMLNLGLAASLGLLSWRMMAMHQVEVDAPEFEFNDLVALISDRESLVGLLSGTTCIAGLLVNGSRGGLVAALFGMAFAFGYVRPRRGLISLPILVVILAISVTVLITPMNLNLETLQRWEVFTGDADTLQSNGRLLHWSDGWQAAMAYFPGGAGLSTYAYAYLPYQEVSPSWWYEHADNLWLELLVETGLVGLVVAVWILAILLFALNRLAVSVDPLDQGLRVAGWYAIAAIMASQFFDYGLVLPANLIAALLLGTAIISRDIANGGSGGFTLPWSGHHRDENPREWTMHTAPEPPNRLGLNRSARGNRWLGGFHRLPCFLLAGLMIGGGLYVIPVLRQDAITDSLLSRLHAEYSRWQLNPEALEEMENVLQERRAADTSPLLFARLGAVQRDRARLAETREWRPQSAAEMGDIYEQLDLSNHTLPYPPESSIVRQESLSSWKHYNDAWQTSLETLQICPLAQAPRGSLLRLFPIIRSGESLPSGGTVNAEAVAHAAAEHLLVFYNGNPSRQFALGEASIRRGDFEAATEGLRAALEADPALTAEVMQLVQDNPELDVKEVIPDSPRVMRSAASRVLQWEQPDPEFLRRAVKTVGSEKDAPLETRAHCEELLGRIHFYLDEIEPAKEHYRQAIRMAPEKFIYRVDYINQLLERGLKSEALRQSRIGRNALPDKPQFQQFIDQIAESERTQTAPSDAVPEIDRSQLDALLNGPNP